MSNVFKGRKSIVLIAAGAMVLCSGLLLRHHSTAKKNPLDDPKLGFQYVYPSTLPHGVRIVSERIDVQHSPNGDFSSIAAEMTFRHEDWVYGVQETKSKNENTSTNLDNYSQSSIRPTCKRGESGRQSFRLCHWIDYGRISVFEVQFIKQGVYITATLPTTLDKPIADSELGAFVASFKPADASGLPVLADAI